MFSPYDPIFMEKKLVVFPVGIGDQAELNILAKFTPKNAPKRLTGLRFKEFFEWLGKSVTDTSHSSPGQEFKTRPTGDCSLDWSLW